MEHYSNRSFVKISEIVEKVMEKQFFLKKTKKIPAVDCGGSATIMTTGVKSLDSLLGSFIPGQLYLIGGAPIVGKESLLLRIALNIVASTTNKPVYILSLEMTAEEMVRRMIPNIINIDLTTARIRSGNFSKMQKNLMYLCWAIMDAIPIYVCDTFVSKEEISRFVENQAGDGALLIDYHLRFIDEYINNENNIVYLKSTLGIIYHMDDIQKLRSLERIFREEYSPKELREKISDIKNAM